MANKKLIMFDFDGVLVDTLFDSSHRNLTIPSELRELVNKLSTRYSLAIISGTMTGSIKKILEREGLDSYFGDVLGVDAESDKEIKIRRLLSEHDVSPTDAIFITDTSSDIYDAKACKVAAVAVTWGFQTMEMLEKSAPAIIVGNPKELESAIEKLLPSA